MSDPRVQKFAKLLAHYSIYAQPREIIGVEGPVFRTRTNEITVEARSVTLLTRVTHRRP